MNCEEPKAILRLRLFYDWESSYNDNEVMEWWSIGVIRAVIQGARYKVQGKEVKCLSQRKSGILKGHCIAVNRVPCTVSHVFQHSITAELESGDRDRRGDRELR